MNGRTFVVIFFFWAFLTIITPTLVHLSETSKSQMHPNGETTSEEIKVRRMMSYPVKYPLRTPAPAPAPTPTPSPAPTPSPSPAPSPSPSPAPAPAPSINARLNQALKNRKAYFGKVLSESTSLVVNKTAKPM